MATADTLAVTVSNKAFPLIERACETAEFLEKAASRTSFPFPEAPLIRSLIHQLAETLVETNEALAACQAQAAGRIRELEARLRAARYDDEIDDGDMDDEVTSGHCECGALHSEGTEEMDCGRCAACGGLI